MTIWDELQTQADEMLVAITKKTECTKNYSDEEEIIDFLIWFDSELKDILGTIIINREYRYKKYRDE